MSATKPFFSVVIPLYNKQNLIKKTIKTVLEQTFQDFEIIIVNDGSKDNSLKIVESLQNNRIHIINQKNQGVSVARNNGIKEAKSDYVAFIDADDVWLPTFLETIHELIIKFPKAGIYATQYELVNNFGQHKQLNIKALPSNDYIGIIPNYFKTVALGNNPTCASALCIPKKIFFENDIWFPEGEKFGEDQHVWSRIAILFDVAYNTKTCALYMIETENNTIGNILKETEPHKSIIDLIEFREHIQKNEEKKYFDIYIQKHIWMIILINIKNNNKFKAAKQLFKYKLPLKNKIFFLFLFFTPSNVIYFLNKIKKKISK